MGYRPSLVVEGLVQGFGEEMFEETTGFPPGLFFLYPSIAVFFLSALVPSMWMYDSILVFSLFLSVKLNLALPIFLVSLFTADLLKTLLIMLVVSSLRQQPSMFFRES